MSWNKKLSINNLILAFITVLAVVALIALAGFFLLTPPDEIIMGQAEATEIRISGKVPGRIESYRFNEGDHVKAGDTLVFLYIPDVEAKLKQVEAIRQAAEAQNQKALKGARNEQITGAFEQWQQAKAGLEVATKSFERVRNLFEKGVASAQKKDEVEATYKSMQALERAAKAQYDLATDAVRSEDKAAAAAQLRQAGGAVSEVESYINESVLISPIDGEITERFPEVGELVGSGSPIMNVANLHEMWITFSIREDLLGDFKIGQEISAFIPALDNQEVTLTVYYMKDMGTYAAWKATKAYGQYDSKTFEVRARSSSRIADLRPGMSVIIQQKGKR